MDGHDPGDMAGRTACMNSLAGVRMTDRLAASALDIAFGCAASPRTPAPLVTHDTERRVSSGRADCLVLADSGTHASRRQLTLPDDQATMRDTWRRL